MKKEYLTPRMTVECYQQEAIASVSDAVEYPSDNTDSLPF